MEYLVFKMRTPSKYNTLKRTVCTLHDENRNFDTIKYSTSRISQEEFMKVWENRHNAYSFTDMGDYKTVRIEN